jgi:hypothetical protein
MPAFFPQMVFWQIIFWTLYLITAVLWVFFYLRVLDAPLRQGLGRRFGVSLQRRGNGLWQVAQPNQGLRGCLIECLQPIFLIPAMIAPLVCFGLVAFALFGNYTEQNPPKVEIGLGGPLSQVKGHDWPRYREDGRLFDVAWIDQPVLVKLRLPSGREIEMASKGTWVGVETEKRSEYAYTYAEGGDAINHVSILPLMETTPPHKLAAQLDRIAANLALTDDPNFKQELTILQAQADSASKCPDFGFHTEMEKNVTLNIRVETHQGFLGDGCFISLDFWWGLG